MRNEMVAEGRYGTSRFEGGSLKQKSLPSGHFGKCGLIRTSMHGTAFGHWHSGHRRCLTTCLPLQEASATREGTYS